ncbi:hypothetical protein V6N13_081413 [Hibiscus sabdariffa]
MLCFIFVSEVESDMKTLFQLLKSSIEQFIAYIDFGSSQKTSRRYVRVVKETDSKSVGLCLRRFESCCRRFFFSFLCIAATVKPLPLRYCVQNLVRAEPTPFFMHSCNCEAIAVEILCGHCGNAINCNGEEEEEEGDDGPVTAINANRCERNGTPPFLIGSGFKISGL